MNKKTRTSKRNPKYVVQLTMKDALELGIVHCDCGHPPNNHFDFYEGPGKENKRPCAHCGCKQLHAHFSRGKAI